MNSLDATRYALTSTLSRTARQWRRLTRHLMDVHGLSDAGALPLITIGRLGDGVHQVTVAEEVGIEGPSLVRLLDQLCACGLVERRDDAADRRAKSLWLTEEGRRITGLVERDLVVLRERVLRAVPQADLEATLRVFRAIEAAVSEGQELAQTSSTAE